MQTSTHDGANLYVDPKRQQWALQVLWPLLPAIGCSIAAATGSTWFYWLTPVAWYGLTALLDYAIGPDARAPAAADLEALEADPYYRRLVGLTVPLYYLDLVYCAWFVASHALPWHAYLGVGVSVGLAAGLAINTGHELGHKPTRGERWLAKLALAVAAYGHFGVEHNLGHHRDVATPEDSASARFGENLYQFAGREIPGAIRRAWRFETRRLAKTGRGGWSAGNTILQALAITIAVYASLIAALGAAIVPLLVIQVAVGWWQLTSANYVEHYGLLRARLAGGRYEPCQPRHSWNSNHVASNLVLFNLQRHSDHHANPARRYQALRAYDDLPELPAGYPAMFVLALIPPLWRRVMDHRVLARAGGALDRVNLGPGARDAAISGGHRT